MRHPEPVTDLKIGYARVSTAEQDLTPSGKPSRH